MFFPSDLILVAAGIVALLAVFAFLSAVLTAQRGRTATYYGVRRETQQRANRRLMLSLALLFLAGILFAGGFVMPDAGQQSALLPATPALTATVANTALASATSASNPSPTPVTEATATVAPSPQPTLAPALESPLNSPLPTIEVAASPTPAVVAPERRLVLNAIASGIDENGLPVGAGTNFQAGTPTIYIFFDYRDVPPNALLRHTWFRDGGSVYYNSTRFNQNGEGMAAIEWSPRGGFKTGLYEVRLLLGGVPQFVANFEVR